LTTNKPHFPTLRSPCDSVQTCESLQSVQTRDYGKSAFSYFAL